MLCWAAGNLKPLVELMAAAESAEAREHILKCLMQAQAETRAHFGGDLAAMAALNGWMADLLASGRSVTTLGLALKVRRLSQAGFPANVHDRPAPWACFKPWPRSTQGSFPAAEQCLSWRTST